VKGVNVSKCEHVELIAVREGGKERLIVDGFKVLNEDDVHPDNDLDSASGDSEVGLKFDLCLGSFCTAVGLDKMERVIGRCRVMKAAMNDAMKAAMKDVIDHKNFIPEGLKNIIDGNEPDPNMKVLALKIAKNGDVGKVLGQIKKALDTSNSEEEFLDKVSSIVEKANDDIEKANDDID